jgi:hypothetical protein
VDYSCRTTAAEDTVKEALFDSMGHPMRVKILEA